MSGSFEVHGDYSVGPARELDAVAPNVISGLVHAEFEGLIDAEAWADVAANEDANRAVLVKSVLTAAP
jgi:hypothetical protein